LFYFEDRSAEQIGEVVCASANTVHVRLHRARAKLRGMLQPLMADK
jgi:DNA-directed RNA polymerase specialized sigma24 family protein